MSNSTATTVTILCANIKCNTVISFEAPTCGEPECLEFWARGKSWLDAIREYSA